MKMARCQEHKARCTARGMQTERQPGSHEMFLDPAPEPKARVSDKNQSQNKAQTQSMWAEHWYRNKILRHGHFLQGEKSSSPGSQRGHTWVIGCFTFLQLKSHMQSQRAGKNSHRVCSHIYAAVYSTCIVQQDKNNKTT